MNPPGEARGGRPPARSSRARARARRRGRLAAERLGATAAAVSAAVMPVPGGEAASPPAPRYMGTDPVLEAGAGPMPVAATVATATLDQPRPGGDPAGDSELDEVPADETPPGSGRRRSSVRNTVEWVAIIGAALIAAVVIKTYLIQAFYIPSASMEPTLEIQDRVLVNKLSYRLHDVHRGDLVVFERPPNDRGVIRDLIKRVIGLPGETVEGKDGTVYVDNRPLREPYLPDGTVTADFGPRTIPEGYVWVMGDNRSNSSDSRVFGAIDESTIIGRAFIRVWPVTALSLL